MPVKIRFADTYGESAHYRQVATETELLEFANKMRAAGEGDFLDALMPSVPSDTNQCLIANALNFKCSVFGAPGDQEDSHGDELWAMYFPRNMAHARIRKIAEAVGCEVAEVTDRHDLQAHSRLCVVLPEEIGLVAKAFDHGHGWPKKYAVHPSED